MLRDAAQVAGGFVTPETLDRIVDSLTLEEQVSLLAGANYWETVAIEHAGIPALRVTDGPAGARGTRYDGPPSINVPCGTALAATWDPSLVEQVGEVLGREARAKGARVLLAPTVNLHRTPIGGRNFECMSEDPHLTARHAVAYVTGVQREGVGCCIKHFVGNDTEFERTTIDSQIDERTQRELYLAPFEAAVREARVAAVMTSYNRIDGVYAADAAELLQGVLRDEWGFDGLVMSDWFGLHSTAAGVAAGCDLEMPGPTIHRGARLVAAVEAGEVDRRTVRTSARRVLALVDRLHGFEDGGPGAETTRHDPADLATIRRAAACGMVLLRNEPVGGGGPLLPLQPDLLRRVAVIGPNAATGQLMGGGSAHVTPSSVSHPLAALTALVEGAGGTVGSARGAITHKRLPAIGAVTDGPLEARFFARPEDLGDPDAVAVAERRLATGHATWQRNPADRSRSEHEFGARITGTLTPTVTGRWSLSVASVGAATLYLDDAVIADNADVPTGGSFFGMGKRDVQVGVNLEAGRTYRLRCDIARWASEVAMSGVELGAFPPVPDDLIGEAVEVARDADVAIVVVGTNDDWESEGWDRETMDLPGRQDELVARVAEVCPRVVVVVNAGSPVSMPWRHQVPAVLCSWFPGQEMGAALVDVLTGAVEPQGRLPVTFPERLADTPAYAHHPGRNGVAPYRERRLMGYRWYDTVGPAPMFPFGFGLGYVPLAITSAVSSGAYELDVTLENETDRDGVEVVQVYAHRIERVGLPDDEPDQRLVGFVKVVVPPGGTRVEFALSPHAYRMWDTEAHAWVVDHTPYELRVGRSSRDVAARLVVRP